MPFLTAWPLATVLEVSEKKRSLPQVLCVALRKVQKTPSMARKIWPVHEVPKAVSWPLVSRVWRSLDAKASPPTFKQVRAAPAMPNQDDDTFVNPYTFCVVSRKMTISHHGDVVVIV